MIMRGSPGAPYSQGSCAANYTTRWFGGPVPSVPVGPMVKSKPTRVRMRRRRGLGDCMNYSDILTQLGGGSENCDPRDSACVMAGTQRANAAEDAMVSSSCIPVGTPISFTPDTSQAALNAFMNNTPIAQPVTVGGATITEIPSGGVTVYQPPPTTTYQPSKPLPPEAPAPPAPPPQNVVNPSPPSQVTTTGSSTTAPGSVTNQANGGVTTPGLLSTVQGYISDLTSGTDIISGVPNWVLLVGGVAVVVMIAQASSGGGRR